MISADNQDIKVGDVVFNRWGEAERITGESHCKDAVYCNRVNGGNVSHVASNTLYKSQKEALWHHASWLASQAFEAEVQAEGYREREKEARRLIFKLIEEERLAQTLQNLDETLSDD